MATAFQQTSFQDDAYQIDEATVETSVVIQGAKRKFRKYVKDENLEKLFPYLRDWEEEKERFRQEKKRQFYPQTSPRVQLIEFPPMPGRAYVSIKYTPDEIRIDKSLDLIAKKSDDDEDEDLIRMLGALD